MAQTLDQARLLRLGPQGRIVIPAELRSALCLRPGDSLVIWLEGDRLVLRPRQGVEEELWDLFAPVEGSLAEELIRQRREEAQRELDA